MLPSCEDGEPETAVITVADIELEARMKEPDIEPVAKKSKQGKFFTLFSKFYMLMCIVRIKPGFNLMSRFQTVELLFISNIYHVGKYGVLHKFVICKATCIKGIYMYIVHLVNFV